MVKSVFFVLLICLSLLNSCFSNHLHNFNIKTTEDVEFSLGLLVDNTTRWLGAHVQSKIIEINELETNKIYSMIFFGNSTYGKKTNNHQKNCLMLRDWSIDKTEIFCHSGEGKNILDINVFYIKYSGVYIETSKQMYIFGRLENNIADFYQCMIGNIETPRNWNCTLKTFNVPTVFSGLDKIMWGTEVVKDGNFVYVFGYHALNNSEHLLRITKPHFDQMTWSEVEYFSSNNLWVKGDDSSIVPIKKAQTKDSNIIYNKKIQRWMMVSKNETKISLLYSDKISGPYFSLPFFDVNETISTSSFYWNIFPIVKGIEFNEFLISYLHKSYPKFIKATYFIMFDLTITIILAAFLVIYSCSCVLIGLIATLVYFFMNFKRLVKSLKKKKGKDDDESEENKTMIEITDIGRSPNDSINEESTDVPENELKDQKETVKREGGGGIECQVAKKPEVKPKIRLECSKEKFHIFFLTVIYTLVETLDGMVWMLIPLSLNSIQENCSGENPKLIYMSISAGQISSLVCNYSLISLVIEKCKYRYLNIHTVMTFALFLVAASFLCAPFIHNIYCMCIVFFCFGVSLSVYFQINKILLNWIWRKKFTIPIYVNAIAYCGGSEIVSIFSSIVFKVFEDNQIQMLCNFWLVAFSFLALGTVFFFAKLPKNPYEQKKDGSTGEKSQKISGFYNNAVFICSLISLTLTAATKEAFKSTFSAYTTSIVPDPFNPLVKMFTESEVSFFFSIFTAVVFVRKCTSVLEVAFLHKIHTYIVFGDFIGIVTSLTLMSIFNTNKTVFWIVGICNAYFTSTIKAALITLPFSGQGSVKFGPTQTTLISICYLLSTPIQTPILSLSETSYPQLMLVCLCVMATCGFLVIFSVFFLNKVISCFKCCFKKKEDEKDKIEAD